MVRCAWLIGTATFILVVFTCQIASPGVIIWVQGDQLTLDVGSAQGVRVGMSGKITKQEMVAGQLQTFEIAKFEVTEAQSSSCTAKLTEVGSGWTVEPGMDVTFDQKLVPPEPTMTPVPRPPATTPTQRLLPRDPAELLRQANAAWDRQDWSRAAELYEALLKQVPGHPIAKERGAAARAKVEAAQRDAEAAQRAAERAQREAEEQAARERAQREALERERQNVPLYRETARTYIDAGQWDKAVEWLRKIVAVDTNDAYLKSVAKSEIEILEKKISDGELEDVNGQLTQWVGLLPEEEVRRLRKIIDIAKQAARAAEADQLVADGDALFQAGDTTRAEEKWKQAVKLEPGYPDMAQRFAKLPPDPGTVDVEPSLEIRFRFIPAGSFNMGSPRGERGRRLNEDLHEVKITRGYWMGETEVTQAQWMPIMGKNPAKYTGNPNRPVDNITWFEAVEFANRLSRANGLDECYKISGKSVTWAGPDCPGFRLPTEAEWERAARAGGAHSLFSGVSSPAIADPEFTWFWGNLKAETSPVRKQPPNKWGLHEMTGNVWEWCWDWFSPYPANPVTDPVGPAQGAYRVFRGGGFGNLEKDMRIAVRNLSEPNSRSKAVGFRLARTAE